MLGIGITLDVMVLAVIVLVSLVIGYMIRRSQIRSLKQKIAELEKEMLSNHADILELQKNKALMEQNIQASKIPVIPLNPTKEEGPEKISDTNKRKGKDGGA